MARSEDPRGLAVWAGLDDFGMAVVSRLEAWLADEEQGPHLFEANQLLTRLEISSASSVKADESMHAIGHAVGELLAGPIARSAVESGLESLLITNIWLVVDAASPAFAALSSWMPRLYGHLDNLGVKAKIYLIVRQISWIQSEAEKEATARRVRAIVEPVASPGSPWNGRTFIFIVTDRNGLAGRAHPDDVTRSIYGFVDMMFLGGIPYSDLSRAFAASTLPTDDNWDLLPIFGSLASQAILWNEPERQRLVNAEGRRQALFSALKEPAPRTFSPPYPAAPKLDVDSQITWPSLKLPIWSPRFWNSTRREFAESQARYYRWLADAKKWRHDMLVTHQDGRAYLEQQAHASRIEYVANLDDMTRTVLDNESIRGFFGSVGRLLERAGADVLVTQKSLPGRPLPADADTQELNAIELIPHSADALMKADQRLIERLERKINPHTLAIVSLGTFAILFGWTLYAAHTIEQWKPPLISGAASSTDESGGIKNWLVERGNERLPGLQDLLPSQLQVAFWAFGIYGLLILAIYGVIVIRQRVALEQGWAVIFKRARAWRNTTISILQDDLKRTEARLLHENIEMAAVEVEGRTRRLEAIQIRGNAPTYAPPAVDPVITAAYPEHIRPPASLTDSQIDRIVGMFKKGRGEDPALLETSDLIMRELMDVASAVAGDMVPDLRREVAEDQSLRAAILNTVPSDAAVMVPPLDPTVHTANGRVFQILGAPDAVASVVRTISPERQTDLQPIPIPDRFYGVALRTEMNARRVFGQYAVRAAVDPIEEVAPEPVSKDGPGIEQQEVEEQSTLISSFIPVIPIENGQDMEPEMDASDAIDDSIDWIDERETEIIELPEPNETTDDTDDDRIDERDSEISELPEEEAATADGDSQSVTAVDSTTPLEDRAQKPIRRRRLLSVIERNGPSSDGTG